MNVQVDEKLAAVLLEVGKYLDVGYARQEILWPPTADDL